MDTIALSMAVALSGYSRRTLWRRIGEGQLHPQPGPGETRLPLDEVLALNPLPLTPADRARLLAADAGDPQATLECALLLLEQDRASGAVSLLERAARHYHPDAMYELARCTLQGIGATAEPQAGWPWLQRAAEHGHALARALLEALPGPAAASPEAVQREERRWLAARCAEARFEGDG